MIFFLFSYFLFQFLIILFLFKNTTIFLARKIKFIIFSFKYCYLFLRLFSYRKLTFKLREILKSYFFFNSRVKLKKNAFLRKRMFVFKKHFLTKEIDESLNIFHIENSIIFLFFFNFASF